MEVSILKLVLGMILAHPPPPRSEVLAYVSKYGKNITALAIVESNLDPFAISRVGAKGVMQLTPVAIKEVYKRGCGNTKLPRKFNVWNYKHNILVGACYYWILRTRYKLGVVMAVAAYNLGLSRVHESWPIETKNHVKRFKIIRSRL